MGKMGEGEQDRTGEGEQDGTGEVYVELVVEVTGGVIDTLS